MFAVVLAALQSLTQELGTMARQMAWALTWWSMESKATTGMGRLLLREQRARLVGRPSRQTFRPRQRRLATSFPSLLVLGKEALALRVVLWCSRQVGNLLAYDGTRWKSSSLDRRLAQTLQSL